MAYVHFIILNNGFDAKFHCTVNGGEEVYFKNGEYIQIDEGKQLLTFDGGGSEWNVQETLSENDCLTIELMVGYNESCGYRTVIGYPEYRVTKCSEAGLAIIEEQMRELAEERAAKSKRIKRIANNVLLAFSVFLLVGAVIASIAGGILGGLLPGMYGIIGLIIHFVVKKKLN